MKKIISIRTAIIFVFLVVAIFIPVFIYWNNTSEYDKLENKFLLKNTEASKKLNRAAWEAASKDIQSKNSLIKCMGDCEKNRIEDFISCTDSPCKQHIRSLDGCSVECAGKWPHESIRFFECDPRDNNFVISEGGKYLIALAEHNHIDTEYDANKPRKWQMEEVKVSASFQGKTVEEKMLKEPKNIDDSNKLIDSFFPGTYWYWDLKKGSIIRVSTKPIQEEEPDTHLELITPLCSPELPKSGKLNSMTWFRPDKHQPEGKNDGLTMTLRLFKVEAGEDADR